MKIVIPTSWEELNRWQQQEIIHIINKTDSEDFSESFVHIVKILLMKKNSSWQYLKMRKILWNVPVSAFRDHVRFIFEPPKFYQFPEIKKLKKPADRIGDFTIEQFSICDTLFFRYQETKAEKQDATLYLRQLVACLYRFGEDFNKQNLPKIAEITDKIPLKEAERIAFIFSSIRNYISDSYPTIFVKSKSEDKEKPAKKPKHQPFSKIITMMAADELRLLGNLKECQNTLIYDFFNAFLESKRIHELKQQALKK